MVKVLSHGTHMLLCVWILYSCQSLTHLSPRPSSCPNLTPTLFLLHTFACVPATPLRQSPSLFLFSVPAFQGFSMSWGDWVTSFRVGFPVPSVCLKIHNVMFVQSRVTVLRADYHIFIARSSFTGMWAAPVPLHCEKSMSECGWMGIPAPRYRFHGRCAQGWGMGHMVILKFFFWLFYFCFSFFIFLKQTSRLISKGAALVYISTNRAEGNPPLLDTHRSSCWYRESWRWPLWLGWNRFST